MKQRQTFERFSELDAFARNNIIKKTSLKGNLLSQKNNRLQQERRI